VPVFSPFKGKVELVELKAQIGEVVKEGQIVAAVEAMKAKHDVRAPVTGKVLTIEASVGADIAAGQPILTIGQ
jgi:biotin carboxyl carrier protein